MKKTLITILTTSIGVTAALYAIGVNEQKKDRIKSLETQLKNSKRINRVYKSALQDVIEHRLDRSDSRELVKSINDDLEFSRIVRDF